MKTFGRILLAFCILLAAAALWFWHEARLFLETSPQSPGKELYFDAPQGASLARIAEGLAAGGLVTDAKKFELLARLKGVGSRLQAGRFSLNTGWKPGKILDVLVNGKPALYRVTIPEGLTVSQTARILEEAGFARRNDFMAAITDPAFLRHYGIPFASAEGFLMPDTYFLKKPDSPMDPPPNPEEAGAWEDVWKKQARSVAGRMIDNFWRKSGALWPNGAKPASRDLKKLVILASIVEKETAIDSERPRVAGVYANRLARNMLLQADPTVAYGLGPDFSGELRRAHLDDAANPYNTYQRPGLPPGPICSFGVAALKAAIAPEKHGYLYFVAKTDGGEHSFSKSLDEHNRAAREYWRQKKAARPRTN